MLVKRLVIIININIFLNNIKGKPNYDIQKYPDRYLYKLYC